MAGKRWPVASTRGREDAVQLREGTNWEAMSRTKQRKRGRTSRGAVGPRGDCALTAATMGKRYVVLCAGQGQCWGSRYSSNGAGTGYRAQQILAGTYMYSWSERLTRGQIVGAFKASVRWRVNGAEAQPVTCPLLRRRRKSCKSKRGQGCEMSKHPQWPAGPSRRRNGDLHEIRHLFFSFLFSPAVLRFDVGPLSVAAVLVQARRLRRQ